MIPNESLPIEMILNNSERHFVIFFEIQPEQNKCLHHTYNIFLNKKLQFEIFLISRFPKVSNFAPQKITWFGAQTGKAKDNMV